MKYRYLFIGALVLFLGGFGFANASILSDSFIKLLNVKSMSVNSNLNHSFKDGLIGESRGSKGLINLNLSSKQDIKNPNLMRSQQDFAGRINMEGVDINLSTGFKLIGDTIYFQIPNIDFGDIATDDISDLGYGLASGIEPYKGKWIKISPQDVVLLESEYPEIKEYYDQAIGFNKNPDSLVLELTNIIKKFTPIFNLKKTESRTVNGVKQDKYLITLNTNKLANIIFLESNKFFGYDTPRERLERQKEIKQSLTTFKMRNAFIFIGQKDKLPYQMSFTIDLLGDNKKVKSSTKFDMSFSDFGSDFTNVIVPPAEYATFTDFYNNAIKPVIEEQNKEMLRLQLNSYGSWNEVVYDELGGKYGTAINNGSCTNPTLGSIFNKPLGDDLENSDYCNECSAGLIKNLIDSSGSEKRCYSKTDAYAVQLSYKDNSGYFCVDSTGKTSESKTLITGVTCND